MQILSESILEEVQKKITDAFSLFDNDSNETVDVRFVDFHSVQRQVFTQDTI